MTKREINASIDYVTQKTVALGGAILVIAPQNTRGCQELHSCQDNVIDISTLNKTLILSIKK